MTTACNQTTFAFHPLGQRPVVAQFSGGKITSDAGGWLLLETERVTGILQQFAACFQDYRNPDLIEHTLEELFTKKSVVWATVREGRSHERNRGMCSPNYGLLNNQRVYALALGYEDLNDHDDLRHDPLPAVLVGKKDPLGQDRRRQEDRGKARVRDSSGGHHQPRRA